MGVWHPSSSHVSDIVRLINASQVAEAVLDAIAASEAATPPMRMFACVDKADMRRQAAEATARLPLLLLLSPACVFHMMTSWGFCAPKWMWQSDC